MLDDINLSGNSNLDLIFGTSHELILTVPTIEQLAERLRSAILQNENITVIEKILDEAGAKAARVIGSKNILGNTSLHLAANRNDLEIVRLLVERLGADAAHVIRSENAFGITALHIAARANNQEMVSLFVEKLGANAAGVIGLQNVLGNTSLHWAVLNNNQEMVDLFEQVIIDAISFTQRRQSRGDSSSSPGSGGMFAARSRLNKEAITVADAACYQPGQEDQPGQECEGVACGAPGFYNSTDGGSGSGS